MVLRIADHLKKHHLRQKKSQPENIIVEIFSSYASGVQLKHIQLRDQNIKISGLSMLARTKLILHKQQIIHTLSEKGISIRDIL